MSVVIMVVVLAFHMFVMFAGIFDIFALVDVAVAVFVAVESILILVSDLKAVGLALGVDCTG